MRFTDLSLCFVSDRTSLARLYVCMCLSVSTQEIKRHSGYLEVVDRYSAQVSFDLNQHFDELAGGSL